MKETVLLRNIEIPLTGDEPLIKVGDEVRDATLVDDSLQPQKLSKYFDKLMIISVFPSIDTETCDMQSRMMMEKYANRDDLVLINISEDLPFAQRRWCAYNHKTNCIVWSDYQTRDFGRTYHLLIQNIELLARSVIVVKDKKVVYFELVKNQDDNVNFEALHKEIDKLLKK